MSLHIGCKVNNLLSNNPIIQGFFFLPGLFGPAYYNFTNFSFFNSMGYIFPFWVLNRSSDCPYFRKQGLPAFDRTVTFVSWPFSHVMLISKSPLAHSPLTEPSAHASGRAGRSWMNPAWACGPSARTGISTMACTDWSGTMSACGWA